MGTGSEIFIIVFVSLENKNKSLCRIRGLCHGPCLIRKLFTKQNKTKYITYHSLKKHDRV